MSALGRFSIKKGDGDPTLVLASRLDYVVVERKFPQPVFKLAEQGYLEPVLQLAYAAAHRQGAIDKGVDFDTFLDQYDVEFLTDDAGDSQGEG